MKFSSTIINIYRKIPLGLSSLLIIAVVCYLTLDPKPFGDEEIPLFPGADKVAHFLMFGALAGALSLDLWRRGWNGPGLNPGALPSSDAPSSYPSPSLAKCILCFIVSSVAGGIIELLQQQMQLGRSAELSDLVADSLGALTGSMIAFFLGRSVSRN